MIVFALVGSKRVLTKENKWQDDGKYEKKKSWKFVFSFYLIFVWRVIDRILNKPIKIIYMEEDKFFLGHKYTYLYKKS